jgi:hypothetical protein
MNILWLSFAQQKNRSTLPNSLKFPESHSVCFSVILISRAMYNDVVPYAAIKVGDKIGSQLIKIFEMFLMKMGVFAFPEIIPFKQKTATFYDFWKRYIRNKSNLILNMSHMDMKYP